MPTRTLPDELLERFTAEPVFTPLYAQLDLVLASNDEGALDDLPMWMVVLFVAEPAAMRWYHRWDLEEARGGLAWAQRFWNIGRRRRERRERGFARNEPELARWLNSPRDAYEMRLRASLWPEDRRVLTRAAIEVLPNGAWRLDLDPA